MTDEQFNSLLNALIGSQGNTERLIRIEEQLSNHLDNFHEKCNNMEKHLIESVPIRDDVKSNTRFRETVSRALWVVYVSIIGLAAKVFFIK